MAQEPDPFFPKPLPNVRYIQPGTPLPLPFAPFVGRHDEIRSIQALLSEPDVRLLTLVGPGGVGKTRLALQSASGLAETLPRATYFVPLAALTSANGIPVAIANVLEGSDGGARPVIETIRALLRDRPTLMILDNVEHLLPDAARVVSDILRTCASLSVLATSRSPLRIYGERRFPVPPLVVSGLRGCTTTPTVEEMCEAVRLFMVRAQAVDPTCRLTDANRDDIIEICRRLDGLPLAIELAAARVAELPPRAYRRLLEQRQVVPGGGAHDLPERQRSLDAAIRWGYELVTPEQQRLLRRLAVLAGPFDIAAARAMAVDTGIDAPLAPGRVLELLSGIVEASLLQRWTDDEGESRYQMLETIRAFCLGEAEALGETEALFRRHAAYYLDQVILANAHLLTGRNLVSWLAHLEDRLSNIRAAMAWCGQHDPLMLSRFTRNLMQYWLRRSRILEGIDWLERARSVASGLAEVEQGWILADLGRLHRYASRKDVEAYYRDALEIALAHDDRELQMAIFIGQAMYFSSLSRIDDAWAAYRAAIAIPNVDTVARTVTQPTFLLAIEAMLTASSGDVDRAVDMATQALARAQREGDDIAPGLLHRILASCYASRGDMATVRDHVLISIETYDAVGEEWNVGHSLVELGGVFLREHPELALRLAGAGDRLLSVHGAQRPDLNREPYRSQRDHLTTTLGEETVRALWDEGGDVPWRRLVEEARTTPADQGPVREASARTQTQAGPLSPREQEVLRLIADGLTDREIASTLGVTYRTVNTHVSNILMKLDVPSRTAAVRRAVREGLIDA